MALRKLIVHGNEFDRKYHDYALKYFPKYEEFRAKFIGCDSSYELMARELSISGIDYNDNNDKKRKVIGQWNYTTFLNFIHLDELSKAIPGFTIDNYTSLERTYLLATHLYYTSNECIKMIGNKLKFFDENKDIGIKGFSDFRNIMAHNVRPLVKIVGHDYSVIDPAEMGKFENINQNQRIDSPIWSDGYNLRGGVTIVMDIP